jgi:ABC-type dipeptide/oligopeptide/nickel transport system ATPase component
MAIELIKKIRNKGITIFMIEHVIKALRDQGMTILLVEQNVQQTLEIADRAYVLENDRIVLEGKSKELLQDDHTKKPIWACSDIITGLWSSQPKIGSNLSKRRWKSSFPKVILKKLNASFCLAVNSLFIIYFPFPVFHFQFERVYICRLPSHPCF